MAKKSKKNDLDENEEINQDANANIDDADDSFGLPDLDYEPIDRTDTDSDTDEPAEEIYATDDTPEEDTADETPVEEKAYVPGSYVPPKDSSMAPKIIVLILVLVLAGVGIWYFISYKPAQEKALAEQQKIEQERIATEKQQAEIAAEKARIAAEAAAAEAARIAEENAKPKIGEVTTMSSRTGRYYVVIASAIDGDLAMDYAKKKAAAGVSIAIIPPFGKSKFHRITVQDHDSWVAAENAANDLKGTYGDKVWVIKY